MNWLNRPLNIGNMVVSNRLVMPPMATSKATTEGRITPQICSYYHEKTDGGYIGLVITEHSYVNVGGKATAGQLSISDDTAIQGFQQLAAIIHKNGAKGMAQISHAGAAAKSEITGQPVRGASAVGMPGTGVTPIELSHTEIQRVIEDFTSAAIRVKNAGFDGVEIHSAHGYLLNQFYSPLTNRRTDAYTGQTLSGRLRLHLEVIESIRSAVGADYPLAIRLGACDYMAGGSTVEDSIAAAKMLAQAGIDLLDISGGFCGYVRPNAAEQGYFSEITQAIKEVVSLPVILTGGILDAAHAERLLESQKADLIGVGRALLRDSLWAKKAMHGAI